MRQVKPSPTSGRGELKIYLPCAGFSPTPPPLSAKIAALACTAALRLP